MQLHTALSRPMVRGSPATRVRRRAFTGKLTAKHVEPPIARALPLLNPTLAQCGLV